MTTWTSSRASSGLLERAGWPLLDGPDCVEILDTLAEGRLLDEVYGYEPGWGFPSTRDRDQIVAIMSAAEEEETETEGPPETSEQGRQSDELAGEEPAM